MQATADFDSRTHSDFGSLGERLRPPGTPFVVLDGRAPGVLIEWLLKDTGWWARVACVEGRELRVAEIAAARLTPQPVTGPPAPDAPPPG